MYIKDDYSFEDLMRHCWSGAIDTLKTIEENNMEEELMQLLADSFWNEIPTMTEVNDFLWFEDEYIFETLGINEEENEEDEY